MKNELIDLIKIELFDKDVESAIDTICSKRGLVAMMVGYILNEKEVQIESEKEEN